MVFSVPAAATLAIVAFALFVAVRLLRSIRLGLSIRMQVFVGMVVLSGGFAALVSLFVVGRLEARAGRIDPHVARASAELLTQILREAAAGAAVLSLFLILATGLSAALIGRAIAKPIERLTQAASRIARGEHHAVLPRPFGREVRTLTAALESMRRELEGHHLAERLAVDLSHEIKNPVAAIRAAAEVLADGALDEPVAARRFVARILEAADRLQSIVHNLLALTRLQARGIADEAVDVGELCLRSVEAHADRAAQKGLSIAFERSPPIGVDTGPVGSYPVTGVEAGAASTAPSSLLSRGDPIWLRRAIDNLIDNALAFAAADPSGARPAVTLRVYPVDHSLHIDVENVGPGVDPAMRDRLFERFVTTRRDSGGSGLGLAIVAAIAEQHRGRIQLVSAGPPVTTFRMSLPRDGALHEIFP